MPEPEVTENYIRIRVRNPNLFVEGSLRTIVIDDKKGIKAVIGKLKSDPNGSTKIQTYLFEKDKWTVEDTQAWVDDHGKGADWVFGTNMKTNKNGGIEMVQPIHKLYSCKLKDFDNKERSFIAIASTEIKDRDGDIVRTSGWILKQYRKNPVILWSHDHTALPIAKSKDIWIEDNQLKFKPIFASADLNPFADQVFRMYQAGFLRSFSVRFDPIEWIELPTEEQKNPFFRARDFKKHELLEISAVNVPSNHEALKSKEMHDLTVKSYFMLNSGVLTDNVEKEKIKKGYFDEIQPVTNVTHETIVPVMSYSNDTIPSSNVGYKQYEYDDNDESEAIISKRRKIEQLQKEKEDIEIKKQQKEIEKSLDSEIEQLEKELEELKQLENLKSTIEEIEKQISVN